MDPVVFTYTSVPSTIAPLKSDGGGLSYSLTVTNQTETDVSVSWINFKGKKEKEQKLSAGAAFSTNTAEYQYWYFKTSSEEKKKKGKSTTTVYELAMSASGISREGQPVKVDLNFFAEGDLWSLGIQSVADADEYCNLDEEPDDECAEDGEEEEEEITATVSVSYDKRDIDKHLTAPAAPSGEGNVLLRLRSRITLPCTIHGAKNTVGGLKGGHEWRQKVSLNETFVLRCIDASKGTTRSPIGGKSLPPALFELAFSVTFVNRGRAELELELVESATKPGVYVLQDDDDDDVIDVVCTGETMAAVAAPSTSNTATPSPASGVIVKAGSPQEKLRQVLAAIPNLSSYDEAWATPQVIPFASRTKPDGVPLLLEEITYDTFTIKCPKQSYALKIDQRIPSCDKQKIQINFQISLGVLEEILPAAALPLLKNTLIHVNETCFSSDNPKVVEKFKKMCKDELPKIKNAEARAKRGYAIAEKLLAYDAYAYQLGTEFHFNSTAAGMEGVRELQTGSGFTLLHEFAHRFHGNLAEESVTQKLERAYKDAMGKKLYKSVHWDVDPETPDGYEAYAATNENEYFAELSEAYWMRNDYFPHTGDEAKEYDPEGYSVVNWMWGLKPGADDE